MTTEINNLISQGLIKKPRLRQSPVPTEQPELGKADKAQPAQADNVVRLDFDQRQAVASVNRTEQYQQQEQVKSSSDKTLDQSVSELSRSVQLIERNLEFRVDDNSGRTVITVKDSDTQEVIRQIPSEQLLQLSARIKELQQDKATDKSVEAQGILFTSRT